MTTYQRIEALADSTHTCTGDWHVQCWACQASYLINDLDEQASALLRAFDAAQVDVTKAP